MKNKSDILLMNNIINVIGYTGIRDKPSKRKTFSTGTLPKLVEEIKTKLLMKL